MFLCAEGPAGYAGGPQLVEKALPQGVPAAAAPGIKLNPSFPRYLPPLGGTPTASPTKRAAVGKEEQSGLCSNMEGMVKVDILEHRS